MFLGLFVLFCLIFSCRIDEMMLIIVYLGEGNGCHAVFRNLSKTREEQFTRSVHSVIMELVEFSSCARNSGELRMKSFLKVSVFVLVDLVIICRKKPCSPLPLLIQSTAGNASLCG